MDKITVPNRNSAVDCFSSSAMRVTIILVTTLFGAAWLNYKGPVPVIRVITPMPEIAPYWHMLSPFPILGMMLADLVALYANYGFQRRVFELGFQVCCLILISYLRLAIKLPISGHALLFAYFIMRRLFISIPVHRGSRIETLIAILLFVILIYHKLFRWDDPITLALGTLLAVLMILTSLYVLGFRKNSPSCNMCT